MEPVNAGVLQINLTLDKVKSALVRLLAARELCFQLVDPQGLVINDCLQRAGYIFGGLICRRVCAQHCSRDRLQRVLVLPAVGFAAVLENASDRRDRHVAAAFLDEVKNPLIG